MAAMEELPLTSRLWLKEPGERIILHFQSAQHWIWLLVFARQVLSHSSIPGSHASPFHGSSLGA